MGFGEAADFGKAATSPARSAVASSAVGDFGCELFAGPDPGEATSRGDWSGGAAFGALVRGGLGLGAALEFLTLSAGGMTSAFFPTADVAPRSAVSLRAPMGGGSFFSLFVATATGAGFLSLGTIVGCVVFFSPLAIAADSVLGTLTGGASGAVFLSVTLGPSRGRAADEGCVTGFVSAGS